MQEDLKFNLVQEEGKPVEDLIIEEEDDQMSEREKIIKTIV